MAKIFDGKKAAKLGTEKILPLCVYQQKSE